jgi:nicotinate-nucleotide adenylyltransferase
VSDLEIRRGGVSYTLDTIRALLRERPGAELFLVIGGDQLAAFGRWRDPEEILALARLVVYRRPGARMEEAPPEVVARAMFVEAPLLALSATEIRERLMAGRTVRYLVPDAVVEYVRRHGLCGA